MESAKPIEPGCLVIILNTALLTDPSKPFAYVGEYLGDDYVYMDGDDHLTSLDKRLWQVDRVMKWCVTQTGKPLLISACPAKFMIRVDDPDIQKSIEAEKETVRNNDVTV